MDLDGKEMWLKVADADGWISKDASKAAELLFNQIEDQIDAEKELNYAMNYHDIEWENEDEERWRFVE